MDTVRRETAGGDNVSTDGGRTSTVDVRGPPWATGSATLVWQLELTAQAGEDRLTGLLRVTRAEPADEPGTVDGSARQTRLVLSHDVAFTADR